MDNLLLGKVLKAMYKLSGKTLTQLSDETGLTVDTINNLFYARVQKPGYIGVCAFVRAAGFTPAELDGFLEAAEALPPDADITERFLEYLGAGEETQDFAGKSANGTVAAARGAVKTSGGTAGLPDGAAQIDLLNREHEKQLDRYRATHLYYVDQLKSQYQEQIGHLEESFTRLKALFDHSVGEIKKTQAAELDRLDGELRAQKKMSVFLTAALIIIAVGAVMIVCIMPR